MSTDSWSKEYWWNIWIWIWIWSNVYVGAALPPLPSKRDMNIVYVSR